MPPTKAETAHKELYERIDSLSQTTAQQSEQIRSIADNMGRLEHVVSDLATTVAHQSNHLASQLNELTAGQAVQQNIRGMVPVTHIWTVVGLVLGVAATLIGSGTIWMSRELAPLKRDMEHVQAQVDNHQADGHPHTVLGQIAALRGEVDERFGEMETKQTAMQAEMRLRDTLAIYRAKHGDDVWRFGKHD